VLYIFRGIVNPKLRVENRGLVVHEVQRRKISYSYLATLEIILMTEGMPRSLLALAAIVALVTISVGIRDYLQEKQAKPPATATIVQSNPITVPKKTTSAKARGARMSATEANVPATTQAAADDMEKPSAKDNPANAVITQVSHGGGEAEDQTNRARNELDTKIAAPALSASVPHCLPLPNATNPRDVDAPYYKNWAKEYSCGI
jgi:hypothetical protein